MIVRYLPRMIMKYGTILSTNRLKVFCGIILGGLMQ